MLLADKVITSFSTGIPGEAVEIRSRPGLNGKIPITVVLPPGSNPGNIRPTVRFIGRSLSPGSGEARDFYEPVTYWVTGEDGSYREYEVRVIVRTGDSKDILWFDLVLSDNLLAEGVVSENPDGSGGIIVIHVPSETNLTSLRAKIVQTGKSIGPLSGGWVKGGVTVTQTDDFSGSPGYRVTAEDGSTKDYTVTVIRDRSSAKEITDFTFTNTGIGTLQVIIGAVPQPDGTYPIVVTIPDTTTTGNPVDLTQTALTPRITYTGETISGEVAWVDSRSGAGTVTAAAGQNFAASDMHPVTYTVTAEDGSSREYAVTVLTSDRKNSDKQLTGFYFIFPGSPATGAAGIINETAKTVAVTVPYGTNLQGLAPVIYHTGQSVSPISGEPRDFRNSAANPIPYTVSARDGSSQTYLVSVFAAANDARALTDFGFAEISGEKAVIGAVPDTTGRIPVVVTVPAAGLAAAGKTVAALSPVATHTGASITGAGLPAGGPGTVTGNAADFTNPALYRVEAEDGGVQEYTVTVVIADDAPPDPSSGVARINGFYFLDPMAVGVIDQDAGMITVTVPYDTGLGQLIPTIYYTGSSIRREGGSEQTAHPAGIKGDFSSLLHYTVTAANGTATKVYGVKVSRGPQPPLRDDREITALTFAEIAPEATTTIIASTQDSSGRFPIEVAVPMGTDIANINLTPKVTHTGVAVSGAGIPAGGPATVTGTATSFRDPVIYTVRAENGQTRVYTVTVKVEDNNAKMITGFYFAEPLAVGAIDEAAKTITVTVPSGTNLSALRPMVYYKGVSLDPVSGRAVNFSSPVIYTVRARNGTVQPYTVTVYSKASSTKDITGITFFGTPVLDTVIGSVPGPDGVVPIYVTVSGDTDITALRADITHTGKTISPEAGSPQNFSGPVSYRITAEDGSTKDYAVTVYRISGDKVLITGFSFKAVPAIVQIDQENHTIDASISYSAGSLIGSLTPVISYIGVSITYENEPVKTANPLTDSPRNFAGPRVYTVAAEDGGKQAYTVTVTVQPQEENLSVSIIYRGVSDLDFIDDSSFNQSTGLLTIKVNRPLLEWYLDGKPHPVPPAAAPAEGPVLNLNVNGLKAGQHEVVLVATGTDGKHYTNKLYFLVEK
ncbi:MAG: DUF5018 domain-containing protein [Spirochaetaceae bacterium]|nr:DUF5018 domain-containing protein [Spirochaetaceae bacterium]